MTDYTDQNIDNLIVNKLTFAKYTDLKNTGQLSDTEVYQITDPENIGGATSWGAIQGTLSNQADLQRALDAKANDTNVVHKTGNETITGAKTFTSHIYQQADSPRVVVKDTTLTRGQAGDGGDAKFQIIDKNNQTLGELRVYNESDGSTSTMVAAVSEDASGNQLYKAIIHGVARKDGTSVVSLQGVDAVYAPHPSASDNSNKIATTNWVADPAKSTSIVHKTGNETIAGTKTFTSAPYSVGETGYRHNMSNYTVGKTPTSNTYPNCFILNDKDGKYFGFYGPEMLTDGSYAVRMGVINQSNNSHFSIIKVGYNSNHKAYASAPSSITSDYGDIKVSTDFQVVSALPSSPTAGVFYFVKE